MCLVIPLKEKIQKGLKLLKYIFFSERKVLVKREKFLEQSLRNKTTALITISVALGIVVIIFIICCIRMKMNTKQRRVDEEYLNEDTLLNEDDRLDIFNLNVNDSMILYVYNTINNKK